MVKPVTRINVIPNLPEPLRRLQELAFNMRWAWDHETIALFRRLDRELWESTGHNPVWMLGLISQEKLQAAAEDPAFMATLNAVCESFDAYMSDKGTWYKGHYSKLKRPNYRLFFDGVRHYRMPTKLFRRLGHSERRPYEKRQRS